MKDIVNIVRDYENIYNLEKILNHTEHLKIIGIDQNICGEKFIVAERMNSSCLDIIFFNVNYEQRYGQLPGVWGTYSKWSGELILIESLKENVGNGTLLLKYFLSEMRQIGKRSIKGTMKVPVDRENYKRLIHFYKKMGFEINNTRELSIELV